MIETSPVLDKIVQLLEKRKIDYDRIIHQPVYTSEEAAQIRDTSHSVGAKSLLLKGDGQVLMLVLPGDRRVNTKKFKADYEIQDLRFCTPEEVLEVTGLEIGAIPPTGNLMDLPTFCDNSLLENEIIAFNAGSHTQSIVMKADDYYDFTKPILGDFSESK